MDTADPPAKPKRKGGRPLRLDQELTDRLCAFIRKGAHNVTASRACGIPPGTVSDWVNRYPGFAIALAQARADHEFSMIEAVSTQALKHATHGQWMLERRYPKRWAPRDKVEVNAHVTGAGLLAFFAAAEETAAAEDRHGASEDQSGHVAQSRKRSA